MLVRFAASVSHSDCADVQFRASLENRYSLFSNDSHSEKQQILTKTAQHPSSKRKRDITETESAYAYEFIAKHSALKNVVAHNVTFSCILCCARRQLNMRYTKLMRIQNVRN